jgi:hypothetical protein
MIGLGSVYRLLDVGKVIEGAMFRGEGFELLAYDQVYTFVE